MIGGLVWPYSSGIFIGECDNGSNMSVSNCLLIGEGGYWGFCYAPFSVSQTNIYSKGDNAREAVPAGIGTLLKDYGLVRTYEHGISYNDRYYVDNNFALSGLGTEDDPVLIGSTADWDKLTDGIRGGYNFSGKPNPNPENKQLLIIPGASHCDLYDGGEGNYIPWDKLAEFFTENLK
jgi:hypothetical protein